MNGGATAGFLLVWFWDSLESIEGLAGETIEKVVCCPEDDRFLVDRDTTVSHFEVMYRP